MNLVCSVCKVKYLLIFYEVVTRESVLTWFAGQVVDRPVQG